MNARSENECASIGQPDFIIRRQGWVSIIIGLGALALISYLKFGSTLDTRVAIGLSAIAIIGVGFFWMPILGVNNLGVTPFRLYRAKGCIQWENVIDADLEKNESLFRSNDSPKTILLITFESGKNVKLGLDWENIEYLLDVIQKQMPDQRISPKLKSLLETGEIPLNA